MSLVCRCALCTRDYYGYYFPNDQFDQWPLISLMSLALQQELECLHAEIAELRQELAALKADPCKLVREMGYHDVNDYYRDVEELPV